MNVLICDNDTTSRFVIKRLLMQHLPCTCLECGDGVEALQMVEEHDIGLLILDVDLPQVDGIEVLQVIRGSESVKTTPVIVISRERREEVIGRLLRLGVAGYLLKPIRTEKFLIALDSIKDRLAKRKPRRVGASPVACLGPDTPAMLIDGNLDYRHFFVSQSQMHGPVIGVPSGAAALSKFRLSPVSLVFIGGDVGILSVDMLIPKLRAMSDTPLRLIGIVDAKTPGEQPSGAFDDVMIRSYVPEKFKAELKRFVQIPEALAAVIGLAGDLDHNLSSAARQVFGMMLDTDIEIRKAPQATGPLAGAIVEMTLQQRYLMVVKIFSTVEELKAIASRMLQMPVEELTEEDYLSTATELANLLTGRLKAALEERGVENECSLPKLETALATWLAPGIADRGVVQHFGLVSAAAGMTLSLEVSDALKVAIAEVA